MKNIVYELERIIRSEKEDVEEYYEFEETRMQSDYDGASNYFGQGDDCYDKGLDAGEAKGRYELASTILKLIKEIN